MRSTALLILLLPGCSLLDTSFYDDNESMLAVEVRYEVSKLECEAPTTYRVKGSIDKLYLYTESKKSRDVHKLVTLMKETSDPLKDTMSSTYCNLKKTVLEDQSANIAKAMMGRY